LISLSLGPFIIFSIPVVGTLAISLQNPSLIVLRCPHKDATYLVPNTLTIMNPASTSADSSAMNGKLEHIAAWIVDKPSGDHETDTGFDDILQDIGVGALKIAKRRQTSVIDVSTVSGPSRVQEVPLLVFAITHSHLTYQFMSEIQSSDQAVTDAIKSDQIPIHRTVSISESDWVLLSAPSMSIGGDLVGDTTST
jgi:hypothetical protein